MVLITFSIFTVSAAASFSGVPYTLNSFGVALFTDLSVAWAESMVATNNWNGVSKSSSHSASGKVDFNSSLVLLHLPSGVLGLAMLTT